jgi:antitoxin component of RelBE/YafQ-DinJ toxin-antitoxin module
MNSKVLFNIDTKLKEQAQKKAKGMGLTFSDIFQMTTRAFVSGHITPGLIQKPEKLNAKTFRELKQISKDIKKGKNLSPVFKSTKEMDDYLNAL